MAGLAALRHFQDGISELKTTVAEALKSDTKLSANSRDSIVELSALRTASLFEELIGKILTLSILEDDSVPSNGAKLPARSEEDLQILLHTQGASKRAWLPLTDIRELLRTADNYLQPGHAFDRLRYRVDDRTAVDELRIVRNAVAHPSDSAGSELEKLARSKLYQVGRPARYLLSKSAGAEEIRILMSRIEAIGIGLSTPDLADANTYLQPERALGPKDSALQGTYECLACGTIKENTTHAPLGRCLSCPTSSPCPGCGKSSNSATQWRRVYGS